MLLQQDEVLLRPWQPEDASWYLGARDDVVFDWTTEPRELTEEELATAIQQVNQSDKIFSLAITDSRSDALLGNIALVRDKTNLQCAEVMYWLAPQGRGRGVATKAVQLVAQWAFATLKVDQLVLHTHQANVASQRVAERAEFRRTKRQVEKLKDAAMVWFVLPRNR